MDFETHFKSSNLEKSVAILSGAEGWKDIQDFGNLKLDWLRKYRKFGSGIPRRHTIARIIGSLEPDNLLACFIQWVNSVREEANQPHLAIDGKTLQRSHNGDRQQSGGVSQSFIG